MRNRLRLLSCLFACAAAGCGADDSETVEVPVKPEVGFVDTGGGTGEVGGDAPIDSTDVGDASADTRADTATDSTLDASSDAASDTSDDASADATIDATGDAADATVDSSGDASSDADGASTDAADAADAAEAGPPSATKSTATATAYQSTPADGASSTSVTVVVRDAAGNPVPGATVTIAGAGATYEPSTTTANASGEASFSAKATTGGQVLITITANGVVVAKVPVRFLNPSRFVWATDNGDHLATWSLVDSVTGELSRGGETAAPRDALDLAIHPSGKWAIAGAYWCFVALRVYAIDATTGALSFKSDSTVKPCNPVAVTFDPSGKFAYSAHQGDNTVGAWSFDDATGALTSLGDVTAASQPDDVLVDPGGKHLWVAGYGADLIQRFPIDSTGRLGTPVNTPVSGGPTQLVLDPTGTRMFVNLFTSRKAASYAIDAAFALTPAGSPVSIAGSTNGVAYDPLQKVLAVADGSNQKLELFDVATTGALAAKATVSTLGSPMSPWSAGRLTFSAGSGRSVIETFVSDATAGLAPADVLRVSRSPSSIVASATTRYTVKAARMLHFWAGGGLRGATVDAKTGMIGTPATTTGDGPLAVAPDGRRAFAMVAGKLTVLPIDPTTGALGAATGSVTPTGDVDHVAVHPSGRWVYVATQYPDKLVSFAVDDATGAITALPATPEALNTGAHRVVLSSDGRFAFVSSGNEVRTFTIHSSGAALLKGATYPGAWDIVSLAIDPTGLRLYVVANSSNEIFSYPIDPFGGLGTPSKISYPSTARELVIAPNGKTAFLSAQDTSVMRFTIDRKTFAWTARPPLPVLTSYGSQAIDPSSTFYFTSDVSTVKRALIIDETADLELMTPVATIPLGGAAWINVTGEVR